MLKVNVDRRQLDQIIRALGRVESKIHYETKHNLPKRGAIRARDMLFENIHNQKFSGGSYGYKSYDEYNKTYSEWKSEMGMGFKGFWRLFDDLVSSLEVFNYRKGVMAGIRSGILDSGGKSMFTAGGGQRKEIAWIARLMEWGWTNPVTHAHVGERPLFRPTRVEFKRKELGKLGDLGIKKIRKEWR